MRQNDIRLTAEIVLVSAFECDDKLGQNQLAKRFNIADVLVNILMKSAFKRGFVKMSKVPEWRTAYYLIPKGWSVGALRISRYIDNSLSFYCRLKVDC